MRPKTTLMLATLLAIAAPLGAQTAAPPAPPAALTAAPPAAAPYSTLKPAPGPGDGTQPRQRLVTVFGT